MSLWGLHKIILYWHLVVCYCNGNVKSTVCLSAFSSNEQLSRLRSGWQTWTHQRKQTVRSEAHTLPEDSFHLHERCSRSGLQDHLMLGGFICMKETTRWIIYQNHYKYIFWAESDNHNLSSIKSILRLKYKKILINQNDKNNYNTIKGFTVFGFSSLTDGWRFTSVRHMMVWKILHHVMNFCSFQSSLC